jgi:hypothetical protein
MKAALMEMLLEFLIFIIESKCPRKGNLDMEGAVGILDMSFMK